MEVLRASCQGVPREIVNQLNYRMDGITETQRVEKALTRLRERYGATNGFMSEKRILEICQGPKIQSWTVASLKDFKD